MDGTKLKAVNSMDKSYTKEFLKKEEGKIEEKIDRFLREMDENDEKEDKESVLDRTKVKEIVEKLKERKNKLVNVNEKMNESGIDEISLTDTEARQMKTRHRIDVCYNAHIAVETNNHLITDYL